MATPSTGRKFLAVTMLPDLYEKAKAEALARDIPVTAFVRACVMAELDRSDGGANKE